MGRNLLPRLTLLGALLFGLAGCETLTQGVVAVDQALYEMVPIHPVTGRPMANLMTEEEEITIAQMVWNHRKAVAQREGIEIDPPGPRLSQIQRVFADLVRVAHRQHLPWEVHLFRDETANALTPGGGMVLVFEGLFTDSPGGNGWVYPRDDEIAAALAHEIGHVTLVHMAERQTSKLFTDRHAEDPFYSASYTTEDEAEADKLSVLYMALAGYDPAGAPRVWAEAHRRQGSAPGLYLYSHPLNAQRRQATAQAASQVQQFYIPREQNPKWAEILHENPLFPRAVATGRQPGAGFLKAVGAAAESMERHERAEEEAEAREQAARGTPQYQASLVRLIATKADEQGRPLIWMQFQNAAQRDVAALGVRVVYLNQRQPLAQDPNCGGPTNIPAGQTVWLNCGYQYVQGADRYQVEITGVQFR